MCIFLYAIVCMVCVLYCMSCSICELNIHALMSYVHFHFPSIYPKLTFYLFHYVLYSMIVILLPLHRCVAQCSAQRWMCGVCVGIYVDVNMERVWLISVGF